MKDRYLIAILYVEDGDEDLWVRAISRIQRLDYEAIHIGAHDWLERCTEKPYDMYVAKAPGQTNMQKQMFDERIDILHRYCQKPIYPSIQELEIYENKKYLAYWLKAHSVPHPRTWVFYDKHDAERFAKSGRLPLVAKINIGSSGKGVRILRSRAELNSYVSLAFSKGIKPYIGPNFRTSSLWAKLRNAYKKKGLLHKRMAQYKSIAKESQSFVILQEYIPHTYEWRAVRIGKSYFAHKKIMKNDKASGSLLKDYANPPLELMDFVKKVCTQTSLSSVSMDIFQTHDGFLVNEIQTYFGQSDAFQMKVDGKIGRYLDTPAGWVFESGDFNGTESYDLRVEHLLEILDGSN